jgi:hypothetical protein
MKHTDAPERIKEIDSPEGHHRLMRSQWREFAALAWRKYLSEGRGAIIVNLRRGKETGRALSIPTNYMAEGSESLARLGGWPGEEVAQIVSEYDPAEDVVFLFLRLDGDVFHYLVSDEISPPQAYQAAIGKEHSNL